MKPITYSRYPVKSSKDLTRIVAIPRRPQEDLNSVRGLAMAQLMTDRLSNGKKDCDCEARGIRCINKLKPVQAWALYEMGITGGAFGALGVGSGKCLGYDTEYFDVATGRRSKISEAKTYLRVPSVLESGLGVAEASCFPSGEKECVKVTLKNGASVIASTDHKVLTTIGWIAASLLSPGDFVAVPERIPSPIKPTQITDSEVKLIAYLMSDGGLSTNMAGFTNMDSDIIKEFIEVATELGTGVTESKSKSKARDFRVKGLIPFRQKWDLFGLAKEKRLHSALWGMSDRHVALFINRFWACDGHISKNNSEITLASEKLIDDLNFLLLRLGINSTKSYTPKRLKGVIFPAWRLTTYGAEVLRFLDVVGDILSKEVSCQKLRRKLNSTKRNANNDIVPIGRKEFKIICNEMNLQGLGGDHKKRSGIRRTEVRNFMSVTDDQYISRNKFIEFCNKYNYNGVYRKLIIEGVRWVRVSRIESDGVQSVYDLSVPESHNFVANNMVVHNTTLGLLAPMVIKDCKLAVLLIPPTLKEQLRREYIALSHHFKMPSLIIEDTGIIVKDAPTLQVIPYSMFSRAKSTDYLEKLKPDLIIADECHRLKDLKSATTSRVLRYFSKNPETRLCSWSGTITSKSIKDYAHLLKLAVDVRSPLPLEHATLEEWALAIDPSDNVAPPGALEVLCQGGESVQQGYYRRLTETLGVVATKTGSIDASLQILERPTKTPPEINKALKSLRDSWTRPDGEELVSALDVASVASQLATGFYYRWRFPRKEPRELIDQWFKVRGAWNKELREKLKGRTEHLDSPLLCENAASRHEQGYKGPLPTWKSEHYRAWKNIQSQVYHQTEPVWISDFLAEDAAQWGEKNKGPIWYEHTAFGNRLSELSGLTQHYGGPEAESRILAEKGDRSIVVSIASHGTGRDGLQRLFCEQLVTTPPGDGLVWEQLLGRLHRQGQTADEITTHVYRHTAEYKNALDKAFLRAQYVGATTGNSQKILSASIGW